MRPEGLDREVGGAGQDLPHRMAIGRLCVGRWDTADLCVARRCPYPAPPTPRCRGRDRVHKYLNGESGRVLRRGSQQDGLLLVVKTAPAPWTAQIPCGRLVDLA